MSLFAIGDLHGCWTALDTLLQTVPIGPDDRIITLGDYVDRGPDTRRVVEWVMAESARGRCLPLRGNHEIMLLEALSGELSLQTWLDYGGQAVLDSYAPAGSRGEPEDIPLEHLRFLDEKLLPGHETATHLFVHATLRPHLPLARQPVTALYWDRFETLQPHDSGKVIICGHTAQKSGVPLNKGYAVCIDTWVYGRGWLTCLCVETGEYWQANQSAEVRSGRLEQTGTNG